MPLPVVDWRRIGVNAPLVLDVAYAGPNAPLPKADAVVITWTTAEWSAFDHVFINSNSTRLPAARDWETGWLLYSAEAPVVPPPPPPTVVQPTAPFLAVNPSLAKPPGPPPPLWGYYMLIQIETKGEPLKVLLFKSNSHLAHAPGFLAVAEMTARIIREAQPRYLYSTGTAGGARPDQKLGDIIVTNCGTIQLKNDINRDYYSLNGKTFSCTDWFAPEFWINATQDYLFFSLANVVNYPALQALVGQLHAQVLSSNEITLDDLLSSALLPEKLRTSQVWPMRNTPLLSTDYYFIAETGTEEKYCFLEMDDAVLAKVCCEMGVNCSLIRNISDPMVPLNGADGQPLAPEVRQRWSGLIYETYGLYTSVNSVLTTWATLAGIDWRQQRS
jgi:nucleoside phosphorylase